MIVIDTSAWIAGLVSGDAHHADTVPFLRLMESQPTQFAVPAHFLAEIAGVLARTGERDEIIENEIRSIDAGVCFSRWICTSISESARIAW